MREAKFQDEDILEVLKMMAPGTPLRDGLDNILRARTGALIVIGDSQEVMKITEGGFFISKEYSPAHLYELAKMDGAIILSKDLKKILYANALLVPDSSIPTGETGTRHKSAERTARQTGEVVISISQRRNIITLYKGMNKYILKDTPTILARANQALQTLEKYKSVLSEAMNNLSVFEFEDIVTLDNVAVVVQRTEMVMRILAEIDRYICELGNEGRLISMQLEELVYNIEEEGLRVIEDYMQNSEDKTPQDILTALRMLANDDLMDLTVICRVLGYEIENSCHDVRVSPKGYRIMDKIPRLPAAIVRKLVDRFVNLQGILKATTEQLDDVEGIGEVRARMIKDGLRKIEDQLLTDNRYVLR